MHDMGDEQPVEFMGVVDATAPLAGGFFRHVPVTDRAEIEAAEDGEPAGQTLESECRLHRGNLGTVSPAHGRSFL